MKFVLFPIALLLSAAASALAHPAASPGGSCPFSPKRDVPSAEGQNPGCTTDTKEAKETQKLFDAWCDHYGFLDNGVGPDRARINPGFQKMTVNEEYCFNNASTEKCIGPLEKLIGRWEGERGQSFNMLPVSDYATELGRMENSASARVPQQPGTDMRSFESTYKEVIVFKQIGNVRNRGVGGADQVNSNCNSNQMFQGVTYFLTVVQTSPKGTRGNKAGDVIHEESGLLLYNAVPAEGGGSGYEIVKMMNVPHGVSVTSLGNFTTFSPSLDSDAKCELVSQQDGAFLNNMPRPFGLCIPDELYLANQNEAQGNGHNLFEFSPHPEEFSTDTPILPVTLNPFLTDETVKFGDVKEFTHIYLEETSTAPTPFLDQQAKVGDYMYDMWITTAEEDGKEVQYLQYGQYSTFQFMTRLECLDCEGVKLRDEKGCILECEGLDDIIFDGKNLTGPGYISDKVIDSGSDYPTIQRGMTFQQIAGMVHGQCYSCTASDSPDRGLAQGISCAEQPLIKWPHNQVNTLRKVSDDTDSPADFEGVKCGSP